MSNRIWIMAGAEQRESGRAQHDLPGRSARVYRGSVAAAALVGLVVVSVVAVGMLTLSSATLTTSARQRQGGALRALADGGVEYGYWQYAWQKASLPYTATGVTLGDGQFTVTVTDNSTNVASTVKIVSTATIGGQSLTITRVVPNLSATGGSGSGSGSSSSGSSGSGSGNSGNGNAYGQNGSGNGANGNGAGNNANGHASSSSEGDDE